MTPPAFSAPCLFLILLNHSRLEIVYFKLPLQATQRYSVREPDLRARQRDAKAVKAPSHKKDRKEQGGALATMTLACMACAVTGGMAPRDITFLSW